MSRSGTRGTATLGDQLPTPRLLAEFTGRERHAARRCQVLLAAGPAEADRLGQAWTGQAVDVMLCESLALMLLRIGRVRPDAVVIASTVDALPPVDVVRTIRIDDDDLPIIVGLDQDHTSLGADVLAAGATAIVRLPFKPDDLLRILSAAPPAGHDLPIRPLPLDLGDGRLRIDGSSPRMWLDGRETLLPPVEYLVLRYLASRPEEIISRVELYEAVWGDRGGRSSNTLTVHLGRIRRRLEGTHGQEWIRSIRGFGYQFIVPDQPHPTPIRPDAAEPAPTNR